jgi:hypothetical protein
MELGGVNGLNAQAWHEDARFTDPGHFGSPCFLTGNSRSVCHNVCTYSLTYEQ